MKPLVLLVDDREHNLDLLEALLEGLDLDLRTATSGEIAIAISAEREPAVVLLDVQMPDMNGYKTAQLLRSQAGRDHLPIIFITATGADDASLFEGYASGCVDYLVKPISPSIVRAKVQVFVDLYRKADQIRLLSEELQRSNADLEDFASAVTHDLRDPLSSIISLGELMESGYGGGKVSEDFDESLEFITNAATRMQDLVDSLLRYSRVGGTQGERDLVDLEDVLTSSIENLQRPIDESSARIERGPMPRLPVNRIQLIQVFQNLIGNGIKYRGEDSPRIKITASKEGEDWRFAISDNGIGIDSRYHDDVFAIFQRLHAEHEYSGSGVGLALVKRVIERHGGSIDVESTPGEGSTFQFTLPSCAAEAN